MSMVEVLADKPVIGGSGKASPWVLLFFNGWQYVAFPSEAIPEAALDFASSKVKSKRR